MVEHKICENHCPKCGGENLDCYYNEISDNEIIFYYTCMDCNADFEEKHEMVYKQTLY